MAINNIKEIGQNRAQVAYTFVESVAKDDNISGKYKSWVKKMPALIKANGLGQTLAFICGKKDKSLDKIYYQLTDWFQKKGLISSGDVELIKEVINMNSTDYRIATLECLSFLNWMRRFVDSLIEKEEEV